MTNSCPDLAWLMILDHPGVIGEFVALKCFFMAALRIYPNFIAIICSALK